ncbi:MAG: hypothetical protein EOO78_27125, partial [Oxalobacteraceae bacterium]
MAQAVASSRTAVPPTLQRWQAEAAAFAAASPAPALLAAVRRAGLERLTFVGWPGKRDEVFRHASVAALLLEAAATPEASGLPLAELPAPLLKEGALRLVLRNGVPCPELSSPAATLAQAGVAYQTLAAALAQPSAELQGQLRGAGAPQPGGAAGVLPALNEAFLQDGVVLQVAANRLVDAPVELLFIADAAAPQRMHHPRVVVVGGACSALTLIEHYHSGDATRPTGTNALSQLQLARGARLDHVVVQRQGAQARHASHIDAQLQQGAALRSFALHVGGATSRQAMRVQLQGPGAEADLGGLYLCRGAQHHATHLTVEHMQPHGRSTQTFKGILAEHGIGDFCGT